MYAGCQLVLANIFFHAEKKKRGKDKKMHRRLCVVFDDVGTLLELVQMLQVKVGFALLMKL